MNTRTERLQRLNQLAAELAQAHRELADLLATEHEAKVQSWFASDETTIQGRDRIASLNALHLSLDIIKQKGEIAAMMEERDNLRFQVEHRGLGG